MRQARENSYFGDHDSQTARWRFARRTRHLECSHSIQAGKDWKNIHGTRIVQIQPCVGAGIPILPGLDFRFYRTLWSSRIMRLK
jgi:hypothetical protein